MPTAAKWNQLTTENHSNHADNSGTKQQQDTQLKVVLIFILLKDALVKQTATRLLQKQRNENSFECSKNGNSAMDVHMVWMKEMI
jgi:hypothetical protein